MCLEQNTLTALANDPPNLFTHEFHASVCCAAQHSVRYSATAQVHVVTVHGPGSLTEAAAGAMTYNSCRNTSMLLQAAAGAKRHV